MKFIYPGLATSQVEESRARYGSNEITTMERETFWDKLLDNFKDPLIIILVIALVITIILAILGYAHWYEGVGIALAVVIATLVATWSEHSNESAFQRLLEEASIIQVKVFRDSKLVELSINELVVRDYILLQPGDTIPADGLLISGHLEVNEASLTGESEAVQKKSLPEEAKDDAATENHKLFRGALIEDGEGVMRITAVGDKTRYGETMKEILSAEDRLSPLQEKLVVLGKHISTFGYVGAIVIFLAFVLNVMWFQPEGGLTGYLATHSTGQMVQHVLTAMILSIIVIVVAVPEGLPMVIAMVLAMNMKKLLSVKVLVRKLLGIETAGSLTILFSDKTGTLTQGQLMIEEVVMGNSQHYQKLPDLPEPLRYMIAFALRNNTSAVIDLSDPQQPKLVGADRTDQAMLRFVTPLLKQEKEIDIVEVIPFNSSRKFSATQVTGEQNLTLIKGAAEVVLNNCTHYLDATGTAVPLTDKNRLEQEMTGLSKRAMRLLAVAISKTPISDSKELPQPLTLLGIFGIRDALRTTSYESVKLAKNAGIHVVMITGDAKETAEAIGRDVGLLEGDPDAKMLTSMELATLSDDQVKAILPHLYVVARAFPTDKSRLVKLAKDMNWVVGMTGDGVNDAPAVKNADVGFAMGSGTEMTKESSDIVILDDNFSSITKAVLYGRTLFKSIRKFIVFQLTVSLSAVLVSFLGQFFGFQLPLTMTQLLWINIIMDTLAGLAFAGEPALQRYMSEPPIPKDEKLINNDMWSSILINGSIAALMSVIFLTADFTKEIFTGEHPAGSPEATADFLTAFFAFFVFMHIFNTFNARTQSFNLFENFFGNKLFPAVIAGIIITQILLVMFGGDIMRTVGLTMTEWAYVLSFAAILIPVDLLRKLIRNHWFGNPVLK